MIDPSLQARALTYIKERLSAGGRVTIPRLRDDLRLASRREAHAVLLALKEAGEVEIRRFRVALPGAAALTYEDGFIDGRSVAEFTYQGLEDVERIGFEKALECLGLQEREVAWARNVLDKAKAYRTAAFEMSKDIRAAEDNLFEAVTNPLDRPTS